jgi:hypothetical protein
MAKSLRAESARLQENAGGDARMRTLPPGFISSCATCKTCNRRIFYPSRAHGVMPGEIGQPSCTQIPSASQRHAESRPGAWGK